MPERWTIRSFFFACVFYSYVDLETKLIRHNDRICHKFLRRFHFRSEQQNVRKTYRITQLWNSIFEFCIPLSGIYISQKCDYCFEIRFQFPNYTYTCCKISCKGRYYQPSLCPASTRELSMHKIKTNLLFFYFDLYFKMKISRLKCKQSLYVFKEISGDDWNVY